MIDVVLVTSIIHRRICERVDGGERKARIGRWIYASKPKRVSDNRSYGSECLMRAMHQLDREDLNVGTITNRKRESCNKRRYEKQ